MQTLQRDEGQTLVLTALAMTLMLGFLALALDVGILFKTRRDMQIAADAAATAGALNFYFYADADKAKQAAQDASKANHYQDGVNLVTVTVNVPPAAGPNQSSGFVEAIISKSVPTLFMGIFGRGAVGVTTRAVAGSPGYSDNCVWVMNKTASAAFDMRGSSGINGPNCSIYVNSSDKNAMETQGSQVAFNGTAIDVVGGLKGFPPQPTGVTQHATAETPTMPLTLDVPSPCGYTFSGPVVQTTDVAAIQTGANVNGVVCFTYSDKNCLKISGNSGGGCVTVDAGVALPGSASGISYVFSHGLTIQPTSTSVVTFGSATQNADGTFSNTLGATLFFPGGLLRQSPGTGQQTGLSIYAPANPNSPYNGLAVVFPASNKDTNTVTIQWGDTGAIFDGMIYAPTMAVKIQDDGNAVAAAGVIADTMSVTAAKNTKAFTLFNYSAANPFTTPLKQITLVE